jgi:hypothetical protein
MMECVRAQSLVAGHISETSHLYLYTVHGFRPNDVGKLLIMAADLTFVIGGGKCVDCAHYLGRMEAPALPAAVAAAGARVRTLRLLSGLRTADAADNSHQSADSLPMCSSPIGTRSTVPPQSPHLRSRCLRMLIQAQQHKPRTKQPNDTNAVFRKLFPSLHHMYQNRSPRSSEFLSIDSLSWIPISQAENRRHLRGYLGR